ncbi:GDYXXLXY domain-containing protein [Winogradskyella sp. A3E31]|uniref:GDYXXLXY domain-containing protein n=1 Tax=Winogradskyella sp. A3E31 TaxID=3349637 RepID=UPI00398BAD9F
MKTIYVFIIFVILVLVQLFIPSKMILDRESILETGKYYKFKTRPVDPNDPFRGKYISLGFDINSAISKDSTIKRDDKVLVYFEDSLGYAKLNRISKNKLDIDLDYVEAEVRWLMPKNETVNFNLPFDRFYMNEYKAKPAEEAYIISQRQRKPVEKPTYALVAVKSGEAVLTNVFIDDIPIAEYVEKQGKH